MKFQVKKITNTYVYLESFDYRKGMPVGTEIKLYKAMFRHLPVIGDIVGVHIGDF